MGHFPKIARAWNWASGVTCCSTCYGAGVIADDGRKRTINDPYPEIACPDCDGEHLPECEVCGCEVIVPGYDCIACYVAEELPAAHLNDADIDVLAKAIKSAAGARLAAQSADLARAAENYIPGVVA